MQKIMMPAKLWCDHAEGFESGLRSWDKHRGMMNVAPIFLRNSLQLGAYPNSATLRAALLQWCYSSRHFGANPTVARRKANFTTRKETVRPSRPTRALQTSTRARTVAELDIGRKTVGDPVEERTTSNISNPQKGKGHSHKKGKGKGKRVDVVETNQPSDTVSTVSHPSQTPSTIGELSCTSNIGHVCDNQFRVNRKTSWCRVFAS